MNVETGENAAWVWLRGQSQGQVSVGHSNLLAEGWNKQSFKIISHLLTQQG